MNKTGAQSPDFWHGVNELKKCPCGETPNKLYITKHGYSTKHAYVYGSCCGCWVTEFRLNYYDLDSSEALEIATKEWNRTLRGFK